MRRKDERVTNGFIERNHGKVRLALADAVLAVQGRYHFSCRERHRRILEKPDRPDVPPDWRTLVEWHGQGVEFKLHPRHAHPPVEELEQRQAMLSEVWMRTFLWVEACRLGKPFASAADYSLYRGRLFPETRPFRNLLLHWRDRLQRGAALPGALDYPRAALQRALVLLLAQAPDDGTAAQHLGLEAANSLEDLEAAYTRWWRCYNYKGGRWDLPH